MKTIKAKFAAGATAVALAGLTAVALSQGTQTPGKPVADKPVVHTKVIRRTIHVTKHAKPKHPPAAAPVEPARGSATATASGTYVATGSSGATETAPVSTASSGAGAEAAPVTTATSGGGGGGGGYEDDGGEVEHEGGDD